MPFQSTIMPDVTPGEMRGMWSVLDMIGNQKAKEAADFLKQISTEKDAAVELHKSGIELGQKAAADKAESDKLAAQAKAHRDEVEDRLSKAEADLRWRIDVNAQPVPSLPHREDDFRTNHTAHAPAMLAHQT